jgi:hypothetical protein
MLISHSRKFLFIHIYKTAGSSLETILAPMCSFRHSRKCRFKHLLLGWPDLFSDDFHRHADALEVKAALHQQVHGKYFAFSFVRNPFAWLVSHYHYICQHPEHHQHHMVTAMDGFAMFARWRVDINARTQKSFIYDAQGQVLVDFIGKCESMNRDFSVIAEKAGVPAQEVPYTNVSKRQPIATYYDKDTERLVAKHWSEDFVTFGYEPYL